MASGLDRLDDERPAVSWGATAAEEVGIAAAESDMLFLRIVNMLMLRAVKDSQRQYFNLLTTETRATTGVALRKSFSVKVVYAKKILL